MSNIHTITELFQNTNQARPAAPNSPVWRDQAVVQNQTSMIIIRSHVILPLRCEPTDANGQIAAATILVNFLQNVGQQQNNTIEIQDITDEAVQNILYVNPIWNHINANFNTNVVAQNARDNFDETTDKLNPETWRMLVSSSVAPIFQHRP